MSARKPKPLLWIALASLGLATSCTSTNPVDDNREHLRQGMESMEAGDLQAASRQMNDVLVATQEEANAFALQRFYALYLLAQIHAKASIDAAFLTEYSRATSRIGGIGQRQGARSDERPSRTGHLVASIYHASLARALYDRAARSGPKKGGAAFLPEELWNLGVDNSDANLQVVMTSAYARLGFWAEVEKTLERSPTLLTLDEAIGHMETYGVQPSLRPLVCAMISRFLRDTNNEEEAYRFAIAAIEGEERFGAPLDPTEIAELEDWILHGASVDFVCPESQTPYLPGQTRSQVSGVPHMEYIAVERLD